MNNNDIQATLPPGHVTAEDKDLSIEILRDVLHFKPIRKPATETEKEIVLYPNYVQVLRAAFYFLKTPLPENKDPQPVIDLGDYTIDDMWKKILKHEDIDPFEQEEEDDRFDN